MRLHGTPWHAGQTRTAAGQSGIVRFYDSSALPDRHGHTPLGVSVVRSDVALSGGERVLPQLLALRGRRAPKNRSLKKFGSEVRHDGR